MIEHCWRFCHAIVPLLLASLPSIAPASAETGIILPKPAEPFAGMVAYHDAQIGRMLDEIERMGQAENPLLLFVEGDVVGSTNSSATIVDRGREDTAWRLSQLDVLGSEKSSGHSQYTDILPTVLEAAGILAPTSLNGVPQQRVDGISFAYNFKGAIRKIVIKTSDDHAR